MRKDMSMVFQNRGLFKKFVANFALKIVGTFLAISFIKMGSPESQPVSLNL